MKNTNGIFGVLDGTAKIYNLSLTNAKNHSDWTSGFIAKSAVAWDSAFEMKNIYIEYNVNKQNIVLLEFNTDKGLSAYCKKDRINCDNAYFGKIGDVLELVCEEYKIKEMIFYVFSLL